ncbi:MAG: hypothetical protein ACQES2_02755 [Pseudomonadota bacterium]
MRLNGWQRIGVVISVAYMTLAIIAIAANIYESKSSVNGLLETIESGYYHKWRPHRDFYSWHDKITGALATREYLDNKFRNQYNKEYPTCDDLKSRGVENGYCDSESDIDDLWKLVGEIYGTSIDSRRPESITFPEFLERKVESRKLLIEEKYKVGLILSIVTLPVLLTWSFFYLVVFLARWIWKGFEKKA